MKKRLFITDLDGTLLNNKCELSENTKQIINSLTSKGVCFSVATARTIMSVEHILDGLDITAPAVLMTGVCIYDMNKREYVHCNYIKQSSLKRFCNIVGGAKDISPYIYTIKDNELCVYCEQMDTPSAKAFAEERKQKYGKRFVMLKSFDELETESALYFVICAKKEIVYSYYKKLLGDPDLYYSYYRDIYDESVYYLEICSSTASKAGGIRYLRENYGFDEIHCFGDNDNDIPMFEKADFSYAVENALPEVKAMATEVIASNENDGVALKMKELCQ
ncbi:MAG: HAD family phosphatase [Ruminococcaceae bacterium]|nr:HAD family phosphatase [Oscillospiraceae bacterium]